MKLLHVDSSILGAHSASRQITKEVSDRLRHSGSNVELVERDLGASPLPHLELTNLPDGHPLAANLDSAVLAANEEARAQSDVVLQEFLDADVVVVGAPMYNFTIPSQLKSWIDRIVVVGKTFSYGAGGPTGLVPGKRVVVVAARGNFYGQGAPAATFEHQDSYLRAVFGFLGITDLEVIVVEGVGAGPDHRETAIERATAAARELRAA